MTIEITSMRGRRPGDDSRSPTFGSRLATPFGALRAAIVAVFVACGVAPSAAAGPAPLPSIPRVVVSGSAGCSLISAVDVQAATGRKVEDPIPAGDSPGGGPVPFRSGCTVSPRDNSFQVLLTDERYATAAAAKARYSPIASRPDSKPEPGIAQGAYVQQPPVSAGLLRGRDYVSLEGLPRSGPDTAGTTAYVKLLRAVSGHFETPTAGGTPRPLLPGDFDPCAFAALLALKQPVLTVTRIGSDRPPMAACRIGLGGPKPLSVVVYTLTGAAQAVLAPHSTPAGQFATLRRSLAPGAEPLPGFPGTQSSPGEIVGLQAADNIFEKEKFELVYCILFSGGSSSADNDFALFTTVLRPWQTFDRPTRPSYYYYPPFNRYGWIDQAGDEHFLPAGRKP